MRRDNCFRQGGLAGLCLALAAWAALMPAQAVVAQPVPGTESFDPRNPPLDVRVRAGETLFDVAERTRSPVQGLIEVNRLSPPYVLRPGQVLLLPPLKVHVVQRGENLNAIADRYGVDRRSLRVFNSLPRDAQLRPGQRIILPALVEDRLTGLEPQDLIDLLAAERAAGRATAPRSNASRRPAQATPARPPATPAPASGSSGMIAQLPPEPGVAPATPPTAAPPSPPATRPSPPPPRRPAASPPPPRLPARVEAPGPGSDGRFGWPLVGKVVETFGDKPGFRRVDGIEIEAAEGAPFAAAAPGTVAYVGNELPGYGWLVLVDHGDDWMTAYAYASRIIVRSGQRVTRGQTLGAVGIGGRARTPRLHFQVRRGINPVDPARQLPRATSA